MKSLVLFAIFISLSIAAGLPFALRTRDGSYANIDEVSVVQSALGRFLSVPLTNTHWPALTNQVLLEGIICCDFVADRAQPKSPAGFVSYLAQADRSPWRLLLLHRMLVIVFFSAGLAALGAELSRRLQTPLAGLLLLLLMHASYLWRYSSMGVGDGLGMGFLLFAAYFAFRSIRPDCRSLVTSLLSGLCFTLALFSRNTTILFLPTLIAIFTADAQRVRWEKLLLSAGMSFVSGCLLAIIVALDPIRWFKANLGNYVKYGAPAGLKYAIYQLAGVGGWWWFCLIVLAGVGLAMFSPWRRIAAGWTIALLLGVFLCSRSPDIEPRYFGGVSVGAAIVATLGCFSLPRSARWRELNLKWIGYAATALAVVGVLVTARPTYRAFVDDAVVTNQQIDRLDAQLAGTSLRIGVPAEAYANFVPFATDESLKRFSARAQTASESGTGVQDFMISRFHLNAVGASVLWRNFAEKEMNYAALTRLATYRDNASSPAGPITLTCYAEPQTAERVGWDVLFNVMDQFERRQLDAVIVPRSMEYVGSRPARRERLNPSFDLIY